MNRYYLLLCLLVLAGGCKEKKTVSPKIFVDASLLRPAADLVSDTVVKEVSIPSAFCRYTGQKGPHVLREILELDIHFPKRKNWMILEIPYTINIQPGSSGPKVSLAADTLAALLQPVGCCWGIMEPGQLVHKRQLLPDNTAEDYTSLGETRIRMNWSNGHSTITGGDDPTVYKPGLSLGDGVNFLSAERIQNDYYASVKYSIVMSAGKRTGSDSADYRYSVVSTIQALDSGILKN